MIEITKVMRKKKKKKKKGVRLTSVTVSDEFEEERALLVIDSPFPGVFDCLPGGDYVHSVDL